MTTINIRNPQFLADGRIDCEIEHPVHGWMPFTASASDAVEHGREIHAAALAMGPEDPLPLSIEDIKAAKNAAINAARLSANQSHFTFAGKQIAVDPLSRSDIDAAHGAILMLGAMPGGWPGGWKALDNSIVPIADLATWGQFYGAMVAQGTANFAHAQALKAQLAAATTAEEVAAVPDW